MGLLIMMINILFYGALIIHIIFAIRLSITLMKRTELDNFYMCLLVTWVVPIFGSIAVVNQEGLKPNS